jgi:hypothetical protein
VDITTLLPRGLTILEKEKEYLMSMDLIASNSSATGAVMIPFASDIMHEMFNQIIKIKVSLGD